jgi:hypothetical protein
MKVICIKNSIPENEKDEWIETPEIVVGNIYVVLKSFKWRNYLLYQLEGLHEGEFGGYDSRCFKPLLENKQVTFEKINEEVPMFSN